MTESNAEQRKTKEVDSQIGPYKLLSVLGEGAYGIVYLAEQQKPIKRLVALKVIKPGMDSKQVIARFEAERQALALLDHPNIAHVFNAGITKAGRPYFAMEHVGGVSLTKYCDQQKLSIKERLELFQQVCEAVQYTHQRGIIHRDIKPSNILVSVEANKAIPKVIDFGVAKALTQPLTERTLFTEQGQLIGTPEYMSPEQAIMTDQVIDSRTDIYSLGVLLYVLLTGTLPFDRKSLQRAGFEEILRIIQEQNPPRPSTRINTLAKKEAAKLAQCRRIDLSNLRRELRGDLDWITFKTMEKDPARRYESAHALAADIQRYLNNEPVVACPPSVVYRLKKLTRRYRTQVIAAACALVVVLLITLVTMIYIPDKTDRATGMVKFELDNPENYLVRAKISFEVEEAEKGFDELEVYASIVKDPEKVMKTYRELALDLLTRKQNYFRNSKIGLRLAKKAVEFDPRKVNMESYYTLALGHYRVGQLKEALAALRKAMKYPMGGNAQNYFLLSTIHWKLGNKEMAKSWFNRAVEWIENFQELPSNLEYFPLTYTFYSEAAEIMGLKDKEFHRKRLLSGEQIGTVTARAGGDNDSDLKVACIVNGSGLGDEDYDRLVEHSEKPEDMWITRKTKVKEGIEFDLGSEYLLGTILVWNYNVRSHTNRGVKRADISVWTKNGSWRKILYDYDFTEAEGSFDYDEPTIVQFDGVKAQKVRFDDLVNFGAWRYIGLSEVQFFQKQEGASQPEPVDGGTIGLRPSAKLSWTAGLDVISNKVFFGTDPNDLKFIGNVKETTFEKLPPLEKRQWYFWRIDGEKEDGSVIEGKVWRFSTGHMVAWYKFDVTDGGITLDSSISGLHGKLIGDAKIILDPERGNVLSLDGDGDYVSCGNDIRFNVTQELTLVGWIKVNKFEREFQTIITKGDHAWRLQRYGRGYEIEFGCDRVGESGANFHGSIKGNKQVNDGQQWHHVAGVYEGTRMYIYIDGKLDVSAKATGRIRTNNWRVLIGQNGLWGSREWNGLLDDVRIYSYVLSEDEIKALYDESKAAP